MMNYIRKHRKISIAIMCILIIILVLVTVFARYIYNIINNYIIETKRMYFYSSVLDINGRNFSIQNWDGFEEYTFTVDLRNYKNEERKTDVDIPYTINIDCGGATSKVTCTTTKGSGGTIDKNTDGDSFNVDVNPKPGVTLTEDDVIKVTTTVTATSPYKKVIYGTYNIGIEKLNFSKKIIDSQGSLYTTLELKNTLSIYKVSQTFTEGGHTYNSGDTVDVETYNSLSDTNKEKCYSAIVTIDLDTSKVKVDTTNRYFINRIENGTYSTTTDSNGFIKKFTIKMAPSSTAEIFFFKENNAANYNNDDTLFTITPILAA